MGHIHYDARVTLKTYSPVKRIGNKFLVLPGHHNGYGLYVAHLTNFSQNSNSCFLTIKVNLNKDVSDDNWALFNTFSSEVSEIPGLRGYSTVLI
jgi:hypothetical protein